MIKITVTKVVIEITEDDPPDIFEGECEEVPQKPAITLQDLVDLLENEYERQTPY